MSARMARRRGRARVAVVAAGVALAGLAAAGCSHQPAAPRGSVASCVEFGIEAIRHHVTVTSLPPACKGLTRAQVNSAVGSALHAAAAGARGKARQRERIAAASHFLERLVTAVPRRRSRPPAPAPAAARQAGGSGLGLAAGSAWLVTLALGLRMMARWFTRRRTRRAPARQPRRPPVLNLAHLGLATTGLLTWIAYLATGVTAVAWAACALLPLVAGLGIALAFLLVAGSPAGGDSGGPTGGDSGGLAGSAASARGRLPARDDPPRTRRPPVLVLGAHIAFATTTILLAFLTAIGAG